MIDIRIYDYFYSWIYKYRKINNKTIQLIAQNNQKLIFDKATTHTKCEKGQIKFCPQINDGIYKIYYFNKLWAIKFEVASKDLIRIYNDQYSNKTNVIQVGKLNDNPFKYTELDKFSNDTDINLFNFSSNSIELRANKHDIGYLINQQEDSLLIKNLKTLSTSHGSPEELILFEYLILQKSQTKS